MPKEWNGPSEYFAAGGLYGNQNRKAIFRSVVPLEGHRFDATDYEEAAADLSLKKEKPCYGEESMDLSTKWRAPPVSPHPTTFAQPAQQQQHHPKHFAQHMRLLPRKRSPPDLVVLSEEELNGDAAMPNGGGGPPSPPLRWGHEELRHKRRILRELRDELRSEEMKLVLLKKLHQSQMMKENLLSQAAAAVAGKILPAAPSHRAAPPPLVRQNSSTLSQNKMLNQQLSSHHVSTTISAASTMMGQHGIGRSGVPTPPLTSYSSATTQVVSQPACPSPERTDGQTPAQRQAAAKLALRKQLEKTLLQIPPPKPPPPEMHFVPNANNQEFICLLGLEKVVDLITDDPSMLRPPPEPFECVQCGTDFSPVWKWQQDAARSRHHHHKPSVICENCVTSNIKRALKAEHTNRLKTAFVKALQQEQEIEQRMAAGAPSPPPIASPSPAPPPCNLPPTTTSHSSLPKLSSMGSSLLQHLPKLTHQSLLHAQQHFAQPAPAHMLPFAPLLAAQAYSYQLLGGKSSAELQRQYLLDMIPPRSSLPQSNWKT